MPRRNRRGRRPGQRPRRYHSTREARRDRRELITFDEPEPKPTPAAECGNCLEWVDPPAASLETRGRCLHPGSGIVAPTKETPACAFYNPRRG